MNVVEELKQTGLPVDSYIVVASGILGALAIRESNDIDLVVKENLYIKLKKEGWAEHYKREEPYLERDGFEVWLSWDSDKPNFEELVKEGTIIEGIWFSSLERVLDWKKRMNRKKDKKDVILIEKYLKKIKPQKN